VAEAFQFEQSLRFWPAIAEEILRAVPASPGVFALRGEGANAQPYVTRAADLRRRMRRLLTPPEVSAEGVPQSKRLNLRDRVRTVEWTVTGSEFESLLLLREATAASFGAADARRRMRLYPPYCLRMTMEHEHPRVYSTNRLASGRGKTLERTYGPFPSRAAAERYADGVLDLFRLRRCWEDLDVHPEHPGCAYGEMKKCMAPCNMGCTPEDYRSEARAVESFLATHGQSMLRGIEAEREAASAAMEFEQAAAAHERYAKVKAVASLADELVRPLPQLRGVIVQAAAAACGRDDAQEAAVFLLSGGCLVGPERLSTLGVRAVREQTSVGSSLFAQPLMLQAVPLDGADAVEVETPEARCEAVLRALEARATRGGPVSDASASEDMGDHLSLLRRWYYRPEKQRAGEFFFPNPDGSWPVRRILRGAARCALGEPKGMAQTDRDGVAAAKVKILHEGREGVERVVPVVKRGRRGKVLSPQLPEG
jgi:excinuclease ABC subunit C